MPTTMTMEQHMKLISTLQNRSVSDILREAVLDLSDGDRFKLETTLQQLSNGSSLSINKFNLGAD